MSKNAEGWIRHRGGKCPVEAGVEVSTRHRDGKIVEVHHMTAYADASAASLKCVWSHKNDDGDIMAYRLHKTVEQVEPFIEAVHAFNALAKVPQLDGPTGWRDRIAEIDATTQALATERAELVQKLASEGFALIERVVEPVEDMSDWRNWKAGDVVTVAIDNDCDLDIGSKHVVRSVETPDYDGEMQVSVWITDDFIWPSAQDESGACVFKFHSRPSA